MPIIFFTERGSAVTLTMNIMLILSPSLHRLEEQSGTRAADAYIKAFLTLLGIMLIIYLLTELTPYAAKFIDRYLGGIMKDKDERSSDSAGDYKVFDIYDGDNNFKSDDGTSSDDDDKPSSDS